MSILKDMYLKNRDEILNAYAHVDKGEHLEIGFSDKEVKYMVMANDTKCCWVNALIIFEIPYNRTSAQIDEYILTGIENMINPL
jgi:hypothetical protein